MQKLRLILLSILVLLLPAGLLSQNLPLLPADPSVTEGRLPDGVGYVIVADSQLKGSADVVLLQRVCQTAETVSFRDLPLHLGSSVLDSLFIRIAGIVASSIEEDPEIYGTDNQYVIIAGDVKPGDVVSRLTERFASVPKSRSSDVPEPYSPSPFKLPSFTCRNNGDGTVTLELNKIRARMRREFLGTAVPLVAMNQDRIAEVILKKSIESSFERLNLPYSDLRYTVLRSWMTSGDESYTLSVKVREGDSEKAREVIQSITGDLSIRELSLNTFVSAREEVWARAFQEMLQPMSRQAQTQRCLAHILYGTPLNTNRSGYDFFASKAIADTVLLRSSRRYMDDVLRLSNPLGIAVPGARVYTVNKRDTTSFPAASRKKAKLSKKSTDFVSGGTLWTFKNGMRVVYKRMPTNGSLYYSMVFGTGAADVQDPATGESAFYEDFIFSADIGNYKGSDFRRLCESCGIFLNCSVGLNDLSIHGEVRTSDLSLLMRSLLALTTQRSPNPVSGAYTLECARLGLRDEDRVGMMLFERLHPTFPYVPYRTVQGLTESLPGNAEALFGKAFSRADDGVLILVGDRKESEVLKVLTRYMDGFAVSGTKKRLSPLVIRTIDGTVTVEGDGERSISMELSAPLPFTFENYFASLVLEVAVNNLLSGLGARAEVSLNVRPNENISLRMSSSADVSKEDLLQVLRMLIEDDELASSLASWKTVTKNRNAFERNQPDYWVYAVKTRYIDVKDIATKSQERIGSVNMEMLRKLSRALLSGGCVVYETN